VGADPEALLLAGGEDYELLFTLRSGAPGAPAVARRLGVPVQEIGRIVAGRGVRVRGASARARGAGGFRHF
jgi:thiamine monophosphate kinase